MSTIGPGKPSSRSVAAALPPARPSPMITIGFLVGRPATRYILPRELCGSTSRGLNVVQLGVARLVVHELVAGRAVPAGFDGRPAGEVTRGVRRVGVPSPPVREQQERPGEFGALG